MDRAAFVSISANAKVFAALRSDSFTDVIAQISGALAQKFQAKPSSMSAAWDTRFSFR
jgi:hypothetical protein